MTRRLLVLAVVCLALAGCESSDGLITINWPTASPPPTTATVTPAPTRAKATSEAQSAAMESPLATATIETTPTSVPGPLSAAPHLISPPDGETVGRGALLTWEADRPLGENEYYVVVVTFTHGQETWHDGAWLTGASWAVPNYFGVGHAVDGWYSWKVVVMRQTGVGDDGRPVGVALSAESESRRFLCSGQ